jgi:3-hydroxybutyryl-CoA dehydrogenase
MTSKSAATASASEVSMDFKKVAVIGGGQMGNGIAHVFALSGCAVALIDVNKEAAEKGLAVIEKNLARQAKKGLITEESAQATGARLSACFELSAAQDADLVIEAVPEKLELKQKIFAELDKLCPPETILATNTSSLPIGEIAKATQRAPKVIGMHFMNPVPVMKLVEIIRGKETSDATYQAVEQATRALGKTPACSNDFPGFIANRILMPMINEAVFALEQGVASKEDIDTTMKLGLNHPMGPLTLADFIGLDTCLFILNVLYDGFKDEKYKPCALLQKLVDQGHLGRKSGQGFYDWSDKK